MANFTYIHTYCYRSGAERSDFHSEVIFGVAVTLHRFSCSHAIFLRNSDLHCRVLLQAGAIVYCLLIWNFIVSKRSISDSCDFSSVQFSFYLNSLHTIYPNNTNK